jgi:hypothetical protein
MPLLLIAILTHVIYKAISNGLDWGGEASRKAWGASLDHSRSLADRTRQRMSDTLNAWDQDPRGRRYAATGVRLALGTGRLLGKIGAGTLFGTLKAAGAVSRALAGGAIATGGLLGSLAGSARWGARAGAEWWRSRHRSRRWRWLDWFPSWADEKADRWWNWGDTFPGEAGDDPYAEDEDEDYRPRPDENDPDDSESRPTPDAGSQPDSEPGSRPDPGDRSWTASAPEPEEEQGPRVVDAEWGDPLDERVEDPTTPGPTPVRSIPAGAPAALGTATAVLDRPDTPAIEGETMPTDLMPANNNAVAPIGSAADGMKFEASLAFLDEQARRARELSQLAEQIHVLQCKLEQAATVMGNDHQAAQDALARFGVVAPNTADAIALLLQVASPAPAAAMVETYVALDAVSTGALADAQDLSVRFGPAWETFKKENVDPEYVKD